MEDKIKLVIGKRREMECFFEKCEINNKDIGEVNNRLKKDREAVEKHLASLVKTNTLIRSHIDKYSNTSQKVAKIVFEEGRL